MSRKRGPKTGTSPAQAVRAAAWKCQRNGLPSTVERIANCISNEIAIENAPARDRVTDAMIQRAAKSLGKRHGLSGASRRRRRR